MVTPVGNIFASGVQPSGWCGLLPVRFWSFGKRNTNSSEEAENENESAGKGEKRKAMAPRYRKSSIWILISTSLPASAGRIRILLWHRLSGRISRRGIIG